MALGLLAAALLATAAAPAAPKLYLGGDLSFTNEMEDCGAVFREGGKVADPFVVLKAAWRQHHARAHLERPGWTKYSTYDDVLKTIRRAHAAGLEVLLDFHYSDDWADGENRSRRRHGPSCPPTIR
jgi:arabinogalactan endo-1,4-beta-galactosidase